MATNSTLRIAMWSGPRNISTAMMRAFENRADTQVCDEPFYAAFLAATGLEHPMRAEVLASQPNDWRAVAAELVSDGEGPEPVWYQKHMCHHMLPSFGLDWMDACANVFLIRDPEQVIASYVRKHAVIDLDAIGVVRQSELFDRVAQRTGEAPAVIDSADVLRDPRVALSRLCEVLGIAFSDRMLNWPAGKRASDGVWAPAWYDVVERATCFDRPVEASPSPLPDELRAIADAARVEYDRMSRYNILG